MDEIWHLANIWQSFFQGLMCPRWNYVTCWWGKPWKSCTELFVSCFSPNSFSYRGSYFKYRGEASQIFMFFSEGTRWLLPGFSSYFFVVWSTKKYYLPEPERHRDSLDDLKCPGQHLGRAWRLGRVTFEASIGRRNRWGCFLNSEIWSHKIVFCPDKICRIWFSINRKTNCTLTNQIAENLHLYYHYITITRWWLQSFLIFTLTFGDDPIWLDNIFEMGWNHQLD